MDSLKDTIRRCLFEAAKPKPQVRDLEGTKLDAGGRGKTFEATFIRALDLVGLEYTKNRVTGGIWDIHPTGSGWERLINEKNVNVKVAGARWMFGGSQFSKVLPWEEIDDVEAFDTKKAAAKVKNIIKAKGISDVVFLSPMSKEVQDGISDAVDAGDAKRLNTLLVRKNFKARQIGSSFDVRVSTKDNRIGSIAIDVEGRVFARSERPRNIAGSMFVGFRAPRDALKRAASTRVKAEAIPAGDCFRFATTYPAEHSKGMFERGVVVHGMCINPDPGPGERDRFEHAWIEYQGKVYDWQTIKLYGMDAPTIKAFYSYWNPYDLKKYTPAKALGNAIAKGHYGPW